MGSHRERHERKKSRKDGRREKDEKSSSRREDRSVKKESKNEDNKMRRKEDDKHESDGKRRDKRDHREDHDGESDVDRRKRRRRSNKDDDSDDSRDDRKRRRKRSSSKKSKKSRHHRRRDDDSSSSTDSRKKRKRYEDDEDRRKDRKKKSKKSKHERRSKHESSREKKEKSIKKLRVDKTKLFPLGDPLGHAPEKLLDPEVDYFAFHQHLWLYLYRDHQIAFNDLTSEQTRTKFEEFVERYNTGKLEKAYYEERGLPSEALDEIKTTRHKWGFQISDREDKNLQMLQEGVRKQTEFQNENIPGNSVATTNNSDKDASNNASTNRIEQVSNERQTDRSTERIHNRRLKEHVRTVEEELTGGRKDGREREIEKRRELAAKIHGASKDREDVAFASELPDDVLYGDDNDSDFKNALAAQKQRRNKKEEQQKARLAELKAREEDKQRRMLEMLGLADKIKPGEKVKINPRNNS